MEPEASDMNVSFPVALIESISLPPGQELSHRQLAYCEHTKQEPAPFISQWRVKVRTVSSQEDFSLPPLVPAAPTAERGCFIYLADDSKHFYPWGLAWSPDGLKLLHTFSGGKSTRLALASIAPNGQPTSVEEYLHPPQYTFYDLAHAPRWSPDGSQVAFISEFQEGPIEIGERLFAPSIFVSDADGGNPHYFVQEDRLPGIVSHPAWSHDGTRVAYVLRVPAANGIGIIAVETGEVTRLDAATVPAIPAGYMESDEFLAAEAIAWFPGDRLIAFLMNSHSASEDILWVMEPDGSNPIHLHRGAINHMALAPDGRALVISEETAPGTYALKRFSFGNSVQTETLLTTSSWDKVTQPGTIIRDLDWTEDGRFLAFASNPTGNFDLFAWDIEAGEVIQLTETPDLDEIAPRWRPPQD